MFFVHGSPSSALLRQQIGNNAHTSDNDQADTLQVNFRICAEKSLFQPKIAAILLSAAVLQSCDLVYEEPEELPPQAPVQQTTLDCGARGYLATELFGALSGKIEWDETELICEGMARPDDHGARLRLAGIVDTEYEIAFIIALPDLVKGAIGNELPSKLTVIEEGAGRFFSSADQEICWTDITDSQEIDGDESRFELSGSLYCVAPLAEVNGDSDITIGDFEFRGLIDWEGS